MRNKLSGLLIIVIVLVGWLGIVRPVYQDRALAKEAASEMADQKKLNAELNVLASQLAESRLEGLRITARFCGWVRDEVKENGGQYLPRSAWQHYRQECPKPH